MGLFHIFTKFVLELNDLEIKKFLFSPFSICIDHIFNIYSKSLDKKSTFHSTLLYRHFRDGCPADTGGRNLDHLRWTLLDHLDTSEQRLAAAGHEGGAKCRCPQCLRLKEIEDKWICRLGTFNGPSGLNSRDEIKARSRVNFVGS